MSNGMWSTPNYREVSNGMWSTPNCTLVLFNK